MALPIHNKFIEQHMFIAQHASNEDIEFFLQPDKGEDINSLDLNWVIADVLVSIGKMPSRSKAFKNGWTQSIPFGFSGFEFGKGRNKCQIWIFNPEVIDNG